MLQGLPWDNLTPATPWAGLDVETRRLAARSVYGPGRDDAASRAEANAAIASALRFRRAAVGRLPIEKRIDYLARAVHPNDSLAGKLLRALHLTQRKKMLAEFLDALEIPQKDGVIESDAAIDPPNAAKLRPAVTRLRQSYPPAEVQLYLATLLAMDPDVWGDLAEFAPPCA